MQKHFILTHGRSGSNYIANTINRHPNLANYGEVLGAWTIPFKMHRVLALFGIGWVKYLDMIYRSNLVFHAAQIYSALSHFSHRTAVRFKKKRRIASIGIKDFCFLMKQRGLTNYLPEREDIKVIYLFRRNQLKRYLSLLYMERTGVVKMEDGSSQANKMYVNTKDMLDQLRTYEAESRIGEDIVSRLKSDRLLRISYEDYFSNSQSILRMNKTIFSFLGVAELEIKSAQRKILSDSLPDLVVNYEEVGEVLDKNGYGSYLK